MLEPFTLCKPNATLTQVVAEAGSIADELNFSDFIVLMAGMSDCLKGRRVSCSTFDQIRSWSRHTNVVVCYVPFWHDRCILNGLIEGFNSDIYRTLSDDGVILLDVNAYFSGSGAAGRGPHYGRRGRLEIVSFIVEVVSGFAPEVLCNTYDCVNRDNLIYIECNVVTDNSIGEVQSSSEDNVDNVEHFY